MRWTRTDRAIAGFTALYLLIALAGVMGGANSEVSDRTTRVLLEAANFDRGVRDPAGSGAADQCQPEAAKGQGSVLDTRPANQARQGRAGEGEGVGR